MRKGEVPLGRPNVRSWGEMERGVGHSKVMLDSWVRRSRKWVERRTSCRRLLGG